MKLIKTSVFTLIGGLCVFFSILIVRTLLITSRQIPALPVTETFLDNKVIVKRLSRAIQYRTVSPAEPTAIDTKEFVGFRTFLANSFAATHATLGQEVIAEHSLLYTWEGQNHRLKPVLLMGHLDVVPVDPKTEHSWTYPPFSGQIADGYIWGRGAMDDKITIMAVLEAVEHLLAEGFRPQRTLYIAFGHDEELGGRNGAAKIADLLRSRAVELEFVLDEGMNIVDGIMPGVSLPLALVGIAEKGYISLELTVEGPGGHASIPPAQTAIGVLSSAIHKLERSPFNSRLSEPMRRLLEFIGPELAWPKRLLLSNLWLFEGLVKRQLTRQPLSSAMLRTTLAATIFEAGVAENVLPTKARAVINIRTLPGDTLARVIHQIRATVDDPQVKIRTLPNHSEPSPVAAIDSEGFKLIHRSLRQVMPEIFVAPALLVAATDSRHYGDLTKNIFRFLPITLRADDTERFHGVNERVGVKDYERCVRFFIQLIRNSSS